MTIICNIVYGKGLIIMNRKHKIILYVSLIVLLLTGCCFKNTFSNQQKIIGEWVSEENICIEFSADGIWKSDGLSESFGGLWEYRFEKFRMEDLSGKTFDVQIRKDEKGEETSIAALVYPEATQFEGKTPEEIKSAIEALVASVNKKLPSFKHITTVEIRDTEFEKNTSRKILRYKVK